VPQEAAGVPFAWDPRSMKGTSLHAVVLNNSADQDGFRPAGTKAMAACRTGGKLLTASEGVTEKDICQWK